MGFTALQEFLDRGGPLQIVPEALAPELRALLTDRLRHTSAEVWFNRLASQSGHRPEEQTVIDALRAGLGERPLRWSGPLR